MKTVHLIDMRIRKTAESLENLVMMPSSLRENTQPAQQMQQPSVNSSLVENMFRNLANEGRGILKQMENYKFVLEQSINMINNVPDLKAKLEQKQKILDSASNQLYGIVFDLENYDVMPIYEEEQLSLTSVDPDFDDSNTIKDSEQEILPDGIDSISMDDEEEDLPEETDLDEEEVSEDEESTDESTDEAPDEKASDKESPKMQGGFEEESEESGEKE